MVFFEPHLMGIDPLVEKNFLGGMPEGLDEEEVKEVRSMSDWLLKPCLKFLREECAEVSPTQDQNLVQSFMTLLMSHMKDFLNLDLYKKSDGSEATAKKNIITMIDAVVVLSIIWSVGCVLQTNSRPDFSTYLRQLLQNKVEGITAYKKLSPEFPERGSVFDWIFMAEELKWIGWMETVDPQQIKPGSAVESIIVQTLDSVRYGYFLQHCIKHRIKLLFCGPTGTGKTAYMQQNLMNLSKEGFTQIMMGFSAQTKCAQTQDLIDAKLDRRRKGVYGPPFGKLCVLMVDDLNMPNKETYGAQPPIEILRQMIDARAYPESGGWFDRKDVTHPFRSIIDVLLFAAMGPPGGGRTFITPRMCGHLYLVGFPLLDDDNMKMIFSTILDWKLQADGYPGEVTGLSKKIVAGTLEIYKSAVASLLPTPLKAQGLTCGGVGGVEEGGDVHYTFNLRDFAKIIFGVLLLKKQECDGVARHVRLWVHEIWRVIGDRLVVNEDRLWMLEQVRAVTKNVFGQGFDEVSKDGDVEGDVGQVTTLDEVRTLIFGDAGRKQRVELMCSRAFYSQHPLPLYLVRRLCAAHLFACLFLELRQANIWTQFTTWTLALHVLFFGLCERGQPFLTRLLHGPSFGGSHAILVNYLYATLVTGAVEPTKPESSSAWDWSGWIRVVPCVLHWVDGILNFKDLQKAYSPPVTDSSAWDARLGRAMLYAGSRVILRAWAAALGYLALAALFAALSSDLDTARAVRELSFFKFFEVTDMREVLSLASTIISYTVFTHRLFVMPDPPKKVSDVPEDSSLPQSADMLSQPAAPNRPYTECPDIPELQRQVESHLEQYNLMSTKKMDLVCFLYMLEHLSRVARVVKTPGGNALLVGVGGSGRQSCSRLACFLADFDVFQIEIARGYDQVAFREDLKKLLTAAGGKGEKTVFLFSDSQIKSEGFVEDLNNLLNTGEVPNLFAPDERVQVCEMVRAAARQEGKAPEGTPNQLYAYFVERCQKLLAIVLCFSPIGDAWRARIRQFPSLVNCCTIDWYTEWPADALVAVAERFLGQVEMEENVRTSCVEMCSIFHSQTTELAVEFKNSLKRIYYATPTSFLELIQTFKTLLGGKRKQVTDLKDKYEKGLDKILTTEQSVEGMKVELINLQPKLIAKNEEVEKMMVVVGEESAKTAKVKEAVAADEAVAAEAAAKSEAQKAEVEADLAEAMPALMEALSALDTLSAKDIGEIKAMKNPPGPVKLVLQAVCIMKGIKPNRVKDESGKMAEDFWGPSVKMVGESDFLRSLQSFDKVGIFPDRSQTDLISDFGLSKGDNIPAATIKKIQTFMPLDDFQPARVAWSGDERAMAQGACRGSRGLQVKTCSRAAWGICMWVRAMETYDRVAKVVGLSEQKTTGANSTTTGRRGPKKEALAIAMAEYAEVMEKLNEKRAELQKVLDQLAELEAQLNSLKAEKDDLAYQVDLCKTLETSEDQTERRKKLDRAETLIESLGGEKSRWTQNAKDLAVDYVNLTGDVIVCSGLIAYLGAFTPDFRERTVKAWTELSLEKCIPGKEKVSLEDCLGEPVKIRNWTICGLPNDAFSIENGIIVDKSRRWPLCIDPQGQANKWIKKMEEPAKLAVKKFTDSDYIRRLEGCITYGNPMLIENILEETDPAIEPVLLKQTYRQGNRVMLKLGESVLEYNKDFKFYLTTKLRNPHYLPEIAVKVTLLNFMITVVGLQDQLLNIVVQAERPELAEDKARLVIEGAENKAQLEETENKILHVLQTSQGNILEDETAINVLSSSKALSNKIAAKQEIAEQTEKQIDEARLGLLAHQASGYVPVAFKTAILFFCISDLANIDPMYQYSLPFFVSLFLSSIEKAEQSEDLEKRIENLNDTFRYTLYCNICRSLFEKHKTLFSFLLCMRLLLSSEEADYDDYRFLLTGGVSLEDPPARPADWVPDRCWGELFRLAKSKEFYQGFHEKFASELPRWKMVYDDVNPMKLLKEPETRPGSMAEFNDFQDLMILRCIRPDRVVPAVLEFVAGKLGEKFVNPPPFDLAGSYADSNAMSPLIFILSPGADPGSNLYRFAAEKGREVASISLGQGQGPKAERLMDIATKDRVFDPWTCDRYGWDGGWVLLQNCHLATSWMPRLERLLDEKDPKKVHKDFRLWLTSYPSNKFPVAILQNGVKMTNEAPKGLRANMTGSYNMDPISNEEFFNACTCDHQFKRLCFNLCFFHAVIQERRLFGPLGWNIAYEFTENDLRISVRQLQMFLDEYPNEAPIKAHGPEPNPSRASWENPPALNYLTGECNYGGRVTEAMDRRLLATLLKSYYCEEALNDDFVLYQETNGPTYVPPPKGGYEEHLDHIRSLPLVTPPGVFGFHENANLTKEMGETYNMMMELLLTAGSSSSSGGSSPDIVVGEIAKDVLSRLPEPWDVAKVQEIYPTLYAESMNTVLAQELKRFNGLLKAIQGSLKDIQKAVKGLLLMSANLETAFFEIFDGKTPAMWLKHSYPSLPLGHAQRAMKPLGGYINDLVERLKFFQKWVDNGAPVMFWFSGIYFTQAFTTGASQNFACLGYPGRGLGRTRRRHVTSVLCLYNMVPTGRIEAFASMMCEEPFAFFLCDPRDPRVFWCQNCQAKCAGRMLEID
ncbi:unnamed protein product [Durusdinium trenchii]|uniref:Uncharacterized protein n=1 Tax=Durusdinium trenchii TaxID=1381693 RepID=A0ABP0P6E7_9DINO